MLGVLLMPDEKDTLIDFSSIEKNLENVHQKNLGIQAIPLEKIVGSLGRYNDFTENFLPHRERISAKYESVKRAVLAGKELPPIKVYKTLDNYFVIDGHHRVTVAKKELDAVAVDAEVIDIHFDLELSTDKQYNYDTDRAKEFLIHLEEAIFQQKTFLKNTILKHSLKVTDLTSYGKLYEEILDFRSNYNCGELAKKNIVFSSYLWYEKHFLPAIEIILQENVLEGFPNRTYTDLYIWLQQHKYYLSQQAGYDVGFDFTKDDFVKKFRRGKFFELVAPVMRDIISGIKKEIRRI